MASLIWNLALIQGLPNKVLLISTVSSRSSAAKGTQSNNSCQMYVTLATISLASGEAATPTWWELLCCKNNKHWLKRKKNIYRGRSSEREYSKDKNWFSRYCAPLLLDKQQEKSHEIPDLQCVQQRDHSTTEKKPLFTSNLAIVRLLAIVPVSIINDIVVA